MLLNVNSEDYETDIIINDTCGKPYSILNRIIKKNFGSLRYQLLNISDNKYHLNIKNLNDSIYLNFDLRDKGIVFYFRYKNTEYVEFCQFNRFSFQSNDNSFIIQTDKNIYDFKILDKLNHNKFLIRLYKFITESKKTK
tara:strand:+ start:510 stop:926 length:417 start_codon:yes stop_codon:yes gene_type:complete